MRRVLFIACLIPTVTAMLAAWTGTVQAALRCDLAYEVFSGATTPPPADLDRQQAFTRSEAEALASLVETALSTDGVTLSSPSVTWGGWRWSNSPSVHVELNAPDSESGWQVARRVAGELAWLYEQDAVLLACDAPDPADPQSGLTDTWLVAAEPESFFRSRDGLFAFYGSLLAHAGRTDRGYTRFGSHFWTVDFGGELEPVLRRSMALFEELGGDSLSFSLEHRPMAVDLVSDEGVGPDSALQAARAAIRERRDAVDQSSSSESPGATTPSETTSQ